jgi:glycosyltransferase involved in cell wall biosynthesis
MNQKPRQADVNAQRPYFSIVTVCLNPGEGLLEIGDSVLGQQNTSLEWIIKDGLSKDGTPARTWTDPRVTLVSKKDVGIFDAMNQALELCSGEYVLFLNVGDSFCGPDSLAKVASAVERAGRPEVFYTYYEYGQAANVIKYPERMRPTFLYRRTVCHQATYVKRECYEKHGKLKASWRGGADDEFFARLVLGARVRHALGPFASTRVQEWADSTKADYQESLIFASSFIRQNYLTSSQRLAGALLYAASLPGLRRKWLSLPQTSRWYRLYLSFSNFMNQHV